VVLRIKTDHMPKREFSFTDAVADIEKILQKIESGDLDIDKLAIEVKRASELIRQCQKKLRTTEEEINSIFRDLV
jgi:exodeoxyribonuclease VII small subunit